MKDEIPVQIRVGENNALIKDTSIPRDCARATIFIHGMAVQQSVQSTAFSAGWRSLLAHWLVKWAVRLTKNSGG